MFDRLQKPYLTVETGEAYQPIRLTYDLYQKDKLIEKLNALACSEPSQNGQSWNWFWKGECDSLHFESLESFRKNPEHPPRLGTISIRDDKLFISLPSFKRACLAVPFFHELFDEAVAKVNRADFINKVFATDDRLPHGFAELFKDEELEQILRKRLEDYAKVQEEVEDAPTAEEAFDILSQYTRTEASKRLPFAERYAFLYEGGKADPDVMFLSFYIFLRSRELVAIHRWYGETGYTLADAIDETVEQVFGHMNIDIIE